MLRWFVCGGTDSQALPRQLSQGESFFVPPQSLRDSSPEGERACPQALRFSRKLYRHAKGSLPEGAGKTVRF